VLWILDFMVIRNIPYHTVVNAVKDLAIRVAYELPLDVKDALRTAVERESNPRARRILEQLIENYQLAESDKIPLCQDTGLAVAFVGGSTAAPRQAGRLDCGCRQ
jgi:fumarate hydratase subunit alpha